MYIEAITVLSASFVIVPALLAGLTGGSPFRQGLLHGGCYLRLLRRLISGLAGVLKQIK